MHSTSAASATIKEMNAYKSAHMNSRHRFIGDISSTRQLNHVKENRPAVGVKALITIWHAGWLAVPWMLMDQQQDTDNSQQRGTPTPSQCLGPRTTDNQNRKARHIATFLLPNVTYLPKAPLLCTCRIANTATFVIASSKNFSPFVNLTTNTASCKFRYFIGKWNL